MTAEILCGKTLSEKIMTGLKSKCSDFFKKRGRPVGLAVVLVGSDPASELYVKYKIKACEEVGIKSTSHVLPQTIAQDDLVSLIQELGSDATIDGILVQLPLPKHLNAREVLSHINPKKDVDGFHIMNAGALFLGQNLDEPSNPWMTACTPLGVIELVKQTGQDFTGKHAVVVGRSNIVGKPAAMLLLQQDCTVTICHAQTIDLASHTRMADILVVAAGKKGLITGDMVKPGAIVVDVGINRHNGKIYGDVNFDEVKKVAGYITPVPGGVGPMTIAMLLCNTLKTII